MSVNIRNSHTLSSQAGIAALLVSIILLALTATTAVYMVRHSTTQQSMSSDNVRRIQAFEAAEAGLQYGIQYLNQNKSSILANPNNGFLNTANANTIQNVNLANNSKYSVKYNNPTVNKYDLILVSSTGVSDDGQAQKTVSQLLQIRPYLINSPSTNIETIQSATLSGSASVQNQITNKCIHSGDSTTISGSAGASSNSTSSGSNSSSSNSSCPFASRNAWRSNNACGSNHTPSSGSQNGCLSQNDNDLSVLSDGSLFQNYFGVGKPQMLSLSDLTFSNTSNINLSSQLNGVTGSTIYVDCSTSSNTNTLTLNGNTTIGTADKPVILIVNGALSITGNVTVYGFIYASSDTNVSGNTKIYGSISTAGKFSMTGNSSSYFDNITINNLNSLGVFTKVPGSWKDF